MRLAQLHAWNVINITVVNVPLGIIQFTLVPNVVFAHLAVMLSIMLQKARMPRQQIIPL
jgi:hypothetical protein